MTSNPETGPALFGRIKIRTSAVVFCGDQVALIRRDRADAVHYTTIGGNVEAGEPLAAALRRELKEELLLDVDQADGGELVWVIDQRVSRPGSTPPPRKIHLVHRYHVTPKVRATLADRECDELPDGSNEVGVIEWVDYRKTSDLPLFPPIGKALAALDSSCPEGADCPPGRGRPRPDRSGRLPPDGSPGLQWRPGVCVGSGGPRPYPQPQIEVTARWFGAIMRRDVAGRIEALPGWLAACVGGYSSDAFRRLVDQMPCTGTVWLRARCCQPVPDNHRARFPLPLSVAGSVRGVTTVPAAR